MYFFITQCHQKQNIWEIGYKAFYEAFGYVNCMATHMNYKRMVRKLSSLHGRKSTPTPKFFGTTEAYFVYHIGLYFQISLI